MSAYTSVSNDPLASVPSTDALHRKKEMGPTGDADILSDPIGIVAKFGRGVSDPTVTYMTLYVNGLPMYFWPNAARNGFEFSTSQP